jgi:predicted nucleic-acid-binding Zn-ribbon protein
MKAPSKCPKCGAEMREGFILDHRLPSRWFAGKVETSILGNIKASGREQRQIESYRCVGCGYLELYASAEIG